MTELKIETDRFSTERKILKRKIRKSRGRFLILSKMAELSNETEKLKKKI